MRLPTFVLLAVLILPGCSVKKFAINKVGDSLAKSGMTYAADDDPELVGQAVPFGLKLMEGLLAEAPKHRGLLLAASSGFTQYSYAYVQEPYEELEGDDLRRANVLKERARRLYLRARDYGVRGLETKHPGFGNGLRENARKEVLRATRRDVPMLYWTAASWGAAIALSKDRPDQVAEQPLVEALIDRAYELEPDFDHGAIEQFLISYEGARQGAKEDFAVRSRKHFERAIALTSGQLASPFVAYAEAVSVQKQNHQEFKELMYRALAVNPDARPEWRLSNLIAQRRARWLLTREQDLFVE